MNDKDKKVQQLKEDFQRIWNILQLNALTSDGDIRGNDYLVDKYGTVCKKGSTAFRPDDSIFRKIVEDQK